MGHRKDRGEEDRRKILTNAVVHRQRVQPVAGLHRMGLVLLQVAEELRNPAVAGHRSRRRDYQLRLQGVVDIPQAVGNQLHYWLVVVG